MTQKELKALRALRDHIYKKWWDVLKDKKAHTSDRFYEQGRYKGLCLAICLLTDKDYFDEVTKTLVKD